MTSWNLKGVRYSKKSTQVLKNFDPDDIRSVAIIRHAAFGDMVLTRNFLIETRNSFPNAKITLSIVSNYNRGVPEDLIDRLHIMEVNEKNKNSITNLINSSRELGYHDLIFDLATTSRSLWLCKLNKAKLKIGFPYRMIYKYLFYDISVPRSDVNFEVDDLLNLLKPFGIKISYPLKFNMPGESVNRERPYLLYFTSASTPNKCWPAEKFTKLISLLSDTFTEYDHLILRGINEWESIYDIKDILLTAKNVFPLESVSSVEEVTAYVKGAKLVISNDTSVRNLAIVCGVPSVGIFFLTPPYRYLPQLPKHLAVYNFDGSIPPVNQVLEAVNKLLRCPV
jgi:ADP-heptose:LPS heptosyltransferase